MRFRRQRLAAWGVHLYTASGGILGMFALFAAADGNYRTTFLLLVVTMLIDATDGLMARRLKVKEVLPSFDGAMMDNVIDILNFAWTPIFVIARIGVLPHPAWVVVPILGALYAYGQSDMKNDEGYFIGFPTYWSIVALYLFWLRPDWHIALALIVIPGILSFVPTRYLYPSKGSTLWRSNWFFGTLWFALVIYLLSQEHPDQLLVLFSLIYPAYYMTASFWVDYRVRRGLNV
jgi:phosphatidylcholine synthase